MMVGRGLVLSLALLAPALGAQGAPPRAVAFVDVNVLAMDDTTAALHRVVVVQDGVIRAIGGPATPIPPGALRIEGGGTRWLVPGLADMHVHAFDRGELLLYLANGVTTIRNLHGLPTHLAWRDSLARGAIVGPRLVTAGPILDGDPPTRGTNVVVRSAAEATAEVDRQAAAGFDLIKVYDNIGVEAYQAVIAAARRHRLPVAGHVPTPVTLAGVLAARQDVIEHVEELLPFFADGRTTATVDSVARAIAAAGVAVTPNLGVHASSLEQVRGWDAVLARAEMRFLNPRTRATWGWDPTGEGRRGNAQGEARWTRTTTFFRDALVPALHRAGVTILAGSDAPIPAIIPGSGFHEELRLLAEAGLAPVEVLRAATRNAARVNGVDDRRGRVRVGFDADLLLVASDPRLGVEALRHRVGVMVGGRWHAQEALDREVAALIATYRP